MNLNSNFILNKNDIEKLNFDKLNGLIPAIIVDVNTEQVLMLGFMNSESLQKTIDTNLITFFSRTRNSLWTKGETSGNYLHLEKILTDCDNDSLLIYANPEGNTCHLGNYSCFNLERKENFNFLFELEKIINERKNNLPENSYTAKLFKEGKDRIIQKVGEEAIETVIASKNDSRDRMINETSDLIYHLLILLTELNVPFYEIINCLKERHK
ncbi:MAG: bifunctional phosphoribosyl-AMP cyclohydrolase/phosphoribosyl-ATP diphosphatase HisIE [Ignavibacterium sp.]